MTTRTLLLLLCFTCMQSPVTQAEQRVVAYSEITLPGRVLLLRHASAPGYGDPPEFALGDCTTQRNLDSKGRAQAVRLGARLRAAGIGHVRILSSQWCRALDTAHLLDLGIVESTLVLNSFFEGHSDRHVVLSGLRALFAALPLDGVPVVLVTHQVVINAFTDAFPPVAGGSVFQVNGTGTPQWLGVLPME